MRESVDCVLYEADGTLLAQGQALLDDAAAPAGAVIAVRQQAGRFVQRCLLGGVRDVRVHFASGYAVPALVERVYFDPRLGRACAVRLPAA